MEQVVKIILTKSKGAEILNTPELHARGTFTAHDPPYQKWNGKAWAIRPFSRWLFLLLFLWGPLLSPAVAQYAKADLTQMNLEDLMKLEVKTVQGASKFEQKTTEAPASVSLVTADQIKKYGYRTLADILRGERSFHITYDRNYTYWGSRGFGRPADYNTRFLLLVDGHRVNDNIYDSAFIGTEFILDVDLIERVEIIRGPGSSLYGSSAFFGVINIIPRKGKNLKGIEASAEAGGFQTYKGRLSGGQQFANGLELLLSGSLLDSRGDKSLYYPEYDAPGTNNGIAEKRDWDRNYSLFANASYGDLSLQGAFISREKGIPTGSYGTDFNAPGNETRDDRGYLDLQYSRKFADAWDFQARLFYDHYQYRGGYIYSGVVNDDSSLGRWWGSEFLVTNTSFENHKITFGAEYRQNFRQDQLNYDVNPYLLRLDDKRDSYIFGTYLQDQFTILKNLILNAGLRYDHYSTFGDTFNPRAALIYSPFEATHLKLIYGQAFRPPNVYEYYYNDGGNSLKRSADLKPEKIDTYELVWEQGFARNLRGSVSLFYYKIKNLIDQTVDPVDGLTFFQNLGSVETKGAEFELEGKWKNGLEARLSYTYQKAKNSDTDSDLTNSPEHLAKLNLIVPVYQDKVFTGVELQYTGKRKTLAGNEADDFLITNLTLFSRQFIKGLEVSASVYNVFNKKYQDPGGPEHLQDLLSQDGINFRFKLTYKY